MPDYRVTWEIDLDASSPREAAEKALEIQRDPASMALVFEVQILHSGIHRLAPVGNKVAIDLLERAGE